MTFFRLPTKDENRGFTLIEILVVIGIIAILAAVVLIAINPARQFAQANDSQRESNVNAILNAVGQYMADNQGDITALNITSGDPEADAWDGINNDDVDDFCEMIVPTYMAALPVDPISGDEAPVEVGDCDDYETGYEIIQDEDTNRISVRAPETQIGDDIVVTR
jgi:type IV pilus assembly protein PilA